MVKKNYLGGLKVLLLPLFIMLLGTFSTCYARTTITDDEAEYIYRYLFTTTYDNNIYVNFFSTVGGNVYKSSAYQNGVQAFKNFFNANNTLDFNPNSTIFWLRNYGGLSNCTIYYANFNNGKIDGLPHLYLDFNPSNTNSIHIGAIDDNKDFVTSYPIYAINCNINSNSASFTRLVQTSLPNTVDFNYIWRERSSTWNLTNVQNGDTLLQSISGLVSFSNTNSVYTNFNGQAIFLTPQPRLLQTLYINGGTVPSDPDTPIPDTGNTGQITDDNGDVTGNIDLSGIQNGIGQINNSINTQGQAIIENQNQNTETIVNALTNSETEQDTESTEEQFDDMISSTENVVDPTVNFFSWLIDNIRTILNSTGNYDLEIPLFGETYTIRSDFFVLPDGDFKTFLQMSFIAWFGWSIIKKIRYIVYAIKCVNISSALNAVDFNPNIL